MGESTTAGLLDRIAGPEFVACDRGKVCRGVLEALPEWFGRPAALESYAAAEVLPMLACSGDDGQVMGFLSTAAQTWAATEIHVIGVVPTYHRRGIGRAMVEAAAGATRLAGAQLLTGRRSRRATPTRTTRGHGPSTTP